MKLEEKIAEFTKATVPQEIVDIIRICALDWIACGLAGRNEPVARFLRQKGLDEGGEETAGIFGGGKLPAARAALVNGATSHALILIYPFCAYRPYIGCCDVRGFSNCRASGRIYFAIS